MSQTYTANLKLVKPDFDDEDWWDDLNDNWDLLDGLGSLTALAVTPAENPSTTLNVKVNAGKFLTLDGAVVSYAGTASSGMTASTVNYIYLTAAGVLTVNTTGYPATGVRLARVTTDGTTVTGIADDRITGSASGDLGTMYLALAGGTLTGALTISTGGLDVTLGGVEIAAGGLTVTAGGGHIIAGGLTIDAGGLIVTAGTCQLPALTLFGNLSFDDALSIVSTAGTGLKIATATTQKLGFFGATPVVQQAGGTELMVSLSNLGLRAATTNPNINIGTGGLTCGTITASGTITTGEATVMVAGTTTGFKFGGNTTQKLGWWNTTPVVQPLGSSDVLASLVSMGLRAASSNPPMNLGSGAITCGTLTLTDAFNVVFGSTTGNKIGSATTQKFAFWNATPIVQPSGAAQVALAAATATSLTDSTTGTADGTLANVTASFDQTILNNNFADLAAKYNALLADYTANRTLLIEIRAVLVNLGLMKGSS